MPQGTPTRLSAMNDLHCPPSPQTIRRLGSYFYPRLYATIVARPHHSIRNLCKERRGQESEGNINTHGCRSTSAALLRRSKPQHKQYFAYSILYCLLSQSFPSSICSYSTQRYVPTSGHHTGIFMLMCKSKSQIKYTYPYTPCWSLPQHYGV